MQIKTLLFAACCLFTVAACHKHEEDSNAPVLTLVEPLANGSVSGEVSIEGDVTDASLHEMEIKVTSDSDGAQLFLANPKVHNETAFHFHEYWTPSISVETAVTLTINVSDHSENITTKTLKFTVKP